MFFKFLKKFSLFFFIFTTRRITSVNMAVMQHSFFFLQKSNTIDKLPD